MVDRWAQEFNGEDDEDEALRLAIAMSLGKEPTRKETPRKQPVVVDLTRNEIDLTQDDIETASEASSPGLPGSNNPVAETMKPLVHTTDGLSQKEKPVTGVEQPSTSPTTVSEHAPVSSLSLLGLDRAKMEEERLARVRKRKAAEEGQSGQSESKRIRPNDEDRPLATAGNPHVLGSVQQRSAQVGAHSASQSGMDTKVMPSRLASSSAQIAANPSDSKKPGNSSQQPNTILKSEHSNLQFPKGVVKKTWVKGQRRLGDDIRFEEVLQKDDLELALISSFQWDQDWMFEKFDLRKTKLILVAMGGDEAENEALRASVPAHRIRFYFPPMNGPGNMHSKLQILKFNSYLRIVVPTGNCVPYDWGETGVMENMVFVIDLPKIEGAERLAANKLTPFGEDLAYFLEAQGIDDGLIRSLVKYDFSETARYGFVHSIAGSHTGDSWRRTGYCGLGRTVNALGLSTTTTIDVDIVTSSLGAVTYDFLQMIYNACQGDSGLREYEIRTASKARKTADAAAVAGRLETLRSHLRVYFPSDKTVRQSLGGKDNAGTIFFHPRWWNQTTFPKVVMRDCQSRRPGLLMHNKVLYVRRHPAPVPDSSVSSTTAGFAYVGSANLSESAWGRLVSDRASGQPKITCRNWECGVVVPVLHGNTARASDRQERDGEILGIFDACVPVPMQTPGTPYVELNSNGTQSSNSRGLGNMPLLMPWFQG